MTEILSSAPGKAFVCGEFVALEGGPAIVAAVSRRATARRVTREGDQWRVRSSYAPRARVVTLAELRKADPQGDLLAAVVQCVSAAGAELPEGCFIASDARRLSDAEERPLGLGSSAASSVALCASLLPFSLREQVERIAVDAHRAFQGGRGSGYDVIASARGGLSTIERDEYGAARVSRTLGPPGLRLLLATGTTAPSTPGVIAALEAARGAETAAILRGMRDAASEAALTLAAGSVRPFISAVREFGARECRLADQIGVDIFPEHVRRLARALEAHRGTAKPSGAGGDGLVCVVVPEGEHEAATSAIEEAGLKLLFADLDTVGLARRMEAD